jgi:hypothetical protein
LAFKDDEDFVSMTENISHVSAGTMILLLDGLCDIPSFNFGLALKEDCIQRVQHLIVWKHQSFFSRQNMVKTQKNPISYSLSSTGLIL